MVHDQAESKEQLEALVQKQITELPKSSAYATFADERGELQISGAISAAPMTCQCSYQLIAVFPGLDVMWASFFADYSDKDPLSPFTAINATHLVAISGVVYHMAFCSFYQRTDGQKPTMEETLEHHHKRCEETWSHVLDNMTIELDGAST
jgi:hypothetical protein